MIGRNKTLFKQELVIEKVRSQIGNGEQLKDLQHEEGLAGRGREEVLLVPVVTLPKQHLEPRRVYLVGAGTTEETQTSLKVAPVVQEGKNNFASPCHSVS